LVSPPSARASFSFFDYIRRISLHEVAGDSPVTWQFQLLRTVMNFGTLGFARKFEESSETGINRLALFIRFFSPSLLRSELKRLNLKGPIREICERHADLHAARAERLAQRMVGTLLDERFELHNGSIGNSRGILIIGDPERALQILTSQLMSDNHEEFTARVGLSRAQLEQEEQDILNVSQKLEAVYFNRAVQRGIKKALQQKEASVAMVHAADIRPHTHESVFKVA
jgi:hypothetical protein